MARRSRSGSHNTDDTAHVTGDRTHVDKTYADDRRTHDTHDRPVEAREVHETRRTPTGPTAYAGHHEAHEKFGGINWGSAFFGWLVAIGMTLILTSIVGAIATAISSSTQITQSEAQREAGTIGIVAGVILLVVLALAYFAGGYVAGRMSRFDGGKQGLAVWVIGLIVTLLAIGLGALFGTEYNLLDRVNLPRIPLSTDQLSWGGIITALAVLVLSLLAAMAGGKVGHRYHDKVDRVAHTDRAHT